MFKPNASATIVFHDGPTGPRGPDHGGVGLITQDTEVDVCSSSRLRQPEWLRLGAVDVGEAVLTGELACGQQRPGPVHDVRVGREGGDGAAEVFGGLGGAEVPGGDSDGCHIVRAEVLGQTERHAAVAALAVS